MVVALLQSPKRNSGKHRSKPNNVRSKQIEVKRLMDDPRADPDSDWHEQWLIDMQELEERYGE